MLSSENGWVQLELVSQSSACWTESGASDELAVAFSRDPSRTERPAKRAEFVHVP